MCAFPLSFRIAALAAGLGALPGAAQLPPLDDYVVRSFGPEDGLPVTEVWEVARDPQGRLLASTAAGIYRYTGYGFLPVDSRPRPDDVFRDLETDARGRVWFLTAAGRVGFVDEGRARAIAVVSNEPWRLQTGPGGLLWVLGTAGLAWVDEDAPEGARSVAALEGVAISAVFDSGGEVFVLSDSGGHRLVVGRSGNGDGPQLQVEPAAEIPAPASIAVRWIDDRGLWIPLSPGEAALVLVEEQGVHRFGPGDAEYDAVHRPGEWIRDVVDSAEGDRWLSFVDADGRSTLVRERAGVRQEIDVRSALEFRGIRHIVPDSEGIVWVTTDQGLIQIAPRGVYALGADDALGSSFTAPVLQTDDGVVWVGTWGGGLFRYAEGRLDRTFTTADGLPNARVRSLHEDDAGRLWVGTALGLALVEDDGVTRVWASSEVRTVVQGPTGALWVGSTEGLHRLEGGRLIGVHPDTFEGSAVYALHPGGDGGLWIGTDHGLYRRAADGTLRRFGADEGLRDDWIDSIHEESDGTLWITTYNAGIHRYRGGLFVPLTTAEGLHHDGIWRMLADDHGGVWMSSDVGLARVDRNHLHRAADALERGERPEPLRPVVFTESAGMPSRESNRASPAGWRMKDGRLLFNNLRGVVVVDPERVLAERAGPRAEVVEVAIDGRSTPVWGEPVVVPAGTRHLGLEFAAHALALPERNLFRVRLDGFDRDWVEVGTRHRVEYTALGPGRYTFEVAAARPLGEWGESTALILDIEPLLWQTTWARLLAALLLIGLAWTAHRFRVRQAIATERMRLRIASDLHDDVGSNLVSIALLSDLVDRSLDTTDHEEQRRRVQRIRGAAQRTVDSLRDIIWLVDPKSDHLEDLVARMRDLAAVVVPDDRLTVRRPAGRTRRSLGLDRARNTLLVFKEALQNALKHAEPDSATVDIEVEAGRLIFIVSDGGPGFDPDGASEAGARAPLGGYGLSNMRRRAAEAGGELTVASAPGGSTIVRFVLPLA
jgi:signal transduction histidine kinase/ligand-binding sensor domain-containing protein